MSSRTATVLFSACILGISLAGCQEAAPSVDVDAETQMIAELSERWAAAESAKDLEGSLALIWDDAVWLAPDAEAVVGIEAIGDLYRGFFEQVPYSSLTIEPTNIKVSDSGDVAYNWGNFILGFEDGDGPSNVALKFLATWEKRDGQWKVTTNMFSYNSPQSPE